jgi:hypothetical protein
MFRRRLGHQNRCELARRILLGFPNQVREQSRYGALSAVVGTGAAQLKLETFESGIDVAPAPKC